MSPFRQLLLPALAAAAALAGPAAAHADTQTWVSGFGSDANPCTRAAPCKTFAGAISKTDAGGVISVLDPAGYGALTITKAITIDARGTYAGVLASTNGIVVNAPSTADVVLRGLTIDYQSPCATAGTLHGIKFLSGRTLRVEDVTARGFPGAGLDVEPSADGSTVSLRDSRLRDNCTAGLLARRASGSVSVLADHNVVTADAVGILAGTGATVRATRNTVVGNASGLGTEAGGQLLSFGDNRVGGNVIDGAPTAQINPPPAPPAATTTTTTTTTTTSTTAAPPATTTTTPPDKTTCRVPWLVGLTLSQARKALAGSHCKLGKVSRSAGSRTRDGRVRKQSPKAGRTVADGTKVGISVNPTNTKRKAKAAVGSGATRTWVTGTGNDANPCSATAPCLTLNGALAKTASGGTVDVLDAGSYGPATVDGPVTIDAGGHPATIVASPGSNGITVNAPAGSVVTLRGLTIVTPGGCTTPGTGNGVTMASGGTLHLEDVITSGFAGAGVSLAPSGDLVATIQGGRIDGNCTAGISATRPSGSVDVSVVEAQLTGDATGVLAGNGATVRIGGSTLSGNATALSATGTGVLGAWPDNAISGNTADGSTPTPLKLI